MTEPLVEQNSSAAAQNVGLIGGALHIPGSTEQSSRVEIMEATFTAKQIAGLFVQLDERFESLKRRDEIMARALYDIARGTWTREGAIIVASKAIEAMRDA